MPWVGRGLRHGHDQVKGYLDEMFSRLLPVSFNVTLHMEEATHAALFGNYSYLVRENDELVRSDWAMVIKVVDRHVSYFSIYEDTFALSRAVRGH